MWAFVIILALVAALLVAYSRRYARHNAMSSGSPDDPDRLWKRHGTTPI